MYDVDSKLLNGIKNIYIDSLACVRMKRDEKECFRIESSCIMSHCLFNVYMDAVMKEVKMRIRRMKVIFMEEGRK